MSITLAAVFESDGEAQEACRKLAKAGIDERSIRVTPSSPSSSAADPEDDRGFIQKLFSLGDDETSSGTYLEAIGRGNPVVTVQLVDESRVDPVSDILDDCGAIDVDERAEGQSRVHVHRTLPEKPVPPASMSDYAGPERRHGPSVSYNGPERRAGH